MFYTQVAADAFQKIQLNAGVLLTDFDPNNPPTEDEMRANIFAATGGGTSFSATTEFTDFGEDIDNIPANTMELKRIDSVTAAMRGTLRTADTTVAKSLMAAADVSGNKITPRADLLPEDFNDMWWVGDYSDINTGSGAGFMAIRLINALSTGGFSLQSNDNGKGDFGFEYTAHYSLENINKVPYEIYIRQGEAPANGGE